METFNPEALSADESGIWIKHGKGLSLYDLRTGEKLVHFRDPLMPMRFLSVITQ